MSFEDGLIDPSGVIRVGFDAHAEIDRDEGSMAIRLVHEHLNT